MKRITVRKGINGIDLKENSIKGGVLIPITIKIYRTEIGMLITENTEANFVLNVVAV
jgi:sRNA-binding carbon storage regulator CsrA